MATPPDDEESRATGRPVKFEGLRGLLKEALDSLGGGEAFLRRERDRFYERDTTKEE
jgi:hypothetical protein